VETAVEKVAVFNYAFITVTIQLLVGWRQLTENQGLDFEHGESYTRFCA
jgi:hypothetical protein